MLEYSINNVFTGEPNFTARIECDESTPDSIKKRLAVLWALKNGGKLTNANLIKVDLSGLYLSEYSQVFPGTVDYSGSDLYGANFSDSNLSFLNLTKTVLRAANFSNAIVDFADFRGADLRTSNIKNVNFAKADLRDFIERDGTVHKTQPDYSIYA